MSAKSLWGRSVLVVDDEDFSRSMVVRMARKLDALQIREAREGQEALGLLRRHGRVDVAVCDFNMPVMNGLELLKAIRGGAAGADARTMPFAMLTGHSDASLVSTAIRLDVSAFLVKPIALDVFSQRMARILVEEHEVGVPGHYQCVDVPGSAPAPEGEVPPPQAAPAPLPVPPGGSPVFPVGASASDPSAGRERRVPLREVPQNAVLARDVTLKSGIKLLSAGQVIGPRLLQKLDDLCGLDDSVHHLWIAV